jgi:tetratricopeptide (TPR) repeat protein
MNEIEETLRRRMAAAEETLADAVWDYARFCQREKVPERAIPRLERLAEYASNPQMRAKLWLAIGQLNETQHTYQAAAQAYARGNALGPSDTRVRYFLRNNEGYCLNQLEAYDLAEECLLDAIEIDPGRHNAHKNLGLALEGRGRYAEAADAFERAVESCPEDRRALNHLEELAERDASLLESERFTERVQRCRRLVTRARPEMH